MLFTGLGKTVPLIYTSLMSEGTGIIIPPATTIGIDNNAIINWIISDHRSMIIDHVYKS